MAQNTLYEHWRAVGEAVATMRPSVYKESLDFQRTVRENSEAASVWGDQRKYNIEHDIPLTSVQQKQQDKIDSVGIPLSRADKPIPNPTLDRDNDQPRLSMKL